MEFAFSGSEDWSGVLNPHVKLLFEETGICYFGQAVVDQLGDISWMMTNTAWAQTYWKDGLYRNEPIYREIERLTLKNNRCLMLWDCYMADANDYQKEIMQKRIDTCKMIKGVTFGRVEHGKEYYTTIGWKKNKTNTINLESLSLVQKYLIPVRILHMRLVEEQKRALTVICDDK